MADIPIEKVAEMSRKCGWKGARCRAALEASGEDVDQTLLKLIETGQIKLLELNPDRTPAALLSEAKAQEVMRKMQKLLKKSGVKMGEKELKEMMEQIRADPDGAEVAMANQEANRQREQAKRSKKKWATQLEMPPFGKLKFDAGAWEGKMVLKTWAAFGCTVTGPADKGVPLSVAPPGDGDEAVPPAAEQVAALEDLQKHEEAVTAAVLEGIFQQYPAMRDANASWSQKRGVHLPEIKKPAEMKDLICLLSVHVLNVAKDGVAYVGFGFSCEWDDEHGLGVLMHGKRVIEVGIADASFEEWPAEQDGGEKV